MIKPEELSIGAVLPIRSEGYRDGQELGRAELLLESLERFAEPGLLSTFVAVVPDNEISLVLSRLGRWERLGIVVLPETELLPELKRFADVSGWRKQQLLKLAAARRVGTDFLLTLDSDVVCTRRLTKGGLLPGGRAILDLEPRRILARWWRGSARVLGVPPKLTKLGMSVTPAILSVPACEELIGFLRARSRGRDWVSLLLNPFRPYDLRKILGYSGRALNWSEYTLYYLYCESHGHLDRFHVASGTSSLPQRLISEHSVWRRVSFDEWDPGIVFSDLDHAFFCVIQGSKEIDPMAVAGRVRPFFA